MSTPHCTCQLCTAHDEILARNVAHAEARVEEALADEHAKRQAEKVDRFIERYGHARRIDKIATTSPEVAKATVEKLRRVFPELAEYLDKAKTEAAPRAVEPTPPDPPDQVFRHTLRGTYEPPAGWMVVSARAIEGTYSTSEIEVVLHLRWKGAR